jgi:DNA-binding MarR family transcriptional regulator
LSPEKQILELDARKKIFNFIYKYPGLHFRELSRKLAIPRSTLNYHLKYLEKRGLITVNSSGKYSLYYVTNNIGNGQKKMIQLFRQETPRNIVLYFLIQTCASRVELSKVLEKHPTTIETHIKKLLDMDIIEPAPFIDGKVHVKHGLIKFVERSPVGKEIIYRLKDCNKTSDLMILYDKRSLDENYVYILPEFYNRWASNNERNEKLQPIKKVIESCEEALFEVFPHPYHI